MGDSNRYPINEIKQIGFANTAPMEEFHFGPDSRWINIVIYHRSRKILDIGSWHELYELREHLVVTATGVEPLSNRYKKTVLEEHVPCQNFLWL